MQSSYSVDMKVMRVASIGLLISILSIGQVRSLECWQCDTFDDSGGCNELNKTASQCKSFEDACIKIVTEFESPHSGPRNRTAEKEQKKCEDKPNSRPVMKYVSKSCGEKNSFEHFAKMDKSCEKETIGGGGTQTRCMCSGNLCNSAMGLHKTVIYSITMATLAISCTVL
ncbi:hypothetical protein EB796_006026 [Bugula neritina]|uniref:Protein quiver n=1 Tax=Bugula neritina TaxID=10212 RepID=A0A7J7KAI4_BUGNE|nr:hypothetical protein EB796_006026 [Bugula neritina]